MTETTVSDTMMIPYDVVVFDDGHEETYAHEAAAEDYYCKGGEVFTEEELEHLHALCDQYEDECMIAYYETL